MMTTTTTNNKSIAIYEYINDGILRVYGTPSSPWFSGKDIATILGYVNTRDAIIKHVDEEDRVLLENTTVANCDGSNSKPHSVLINESGLYSLILRSKKKEAKDFKRWVTSEVLPSIRKTGGYNTDKVLVNQKQLKVQETIDVINLFDKIETSHLDERDKLLFRDYSRNLFLDCHHNMLELKNDNIEWSISKRLQEIYGLTGKKIRNMTVNFGKILLKKYKEIYNTAPPKREQFVDGTTRPVNCYFLKDWEQFGDDLLEEYFKDFIKVEIVESEE
jgi:prophage antirepressor-like protein